MSPVVVNGLGERDIFDFRKPVSIRPFPLRKSLLYGFICLLWLSFGIIGRDPWKPEETLLVAIIASNYADDVGLMPLPMAALTISQPPLYIWLSGLTAKAAAVVLSWPIHEGARLANIILIALGFLLTGFSVRRLYGLRVAWLALLLMVGTVGFMVRAHVLNFGIAPFLGVAMILAGVTVLIDRQRRVFAPLLGGLGIGIGLNFLLWSVAGVTAFILAVALTVWLIASIRGRAITVLSIVLVFSLPSIFLWLRTQLADTLWMTLIANKWSYYSVEHVLSVIVGDCRIVAWSLFPILPLAIFGWWNERQRFIPLQKFCWLLVVVLLLVFVVEGQGEEDLYMLLPPLSVLAARALHSIRKDRARLFDFFALFVIGLFFGGGLWLIWGGLYTQSSLVDVITDLYPGFVLPPVVWGKVAVAVILTVGWLLLISNLGHSNERVAVNWSVGITLIWALTNLLLVGYIDSGKSYRPVAKSILPYVEKSCVQWPTDKHWRAQLYYFGVSLGGPECPFYLEAAPASLSSPVPVVWRGGRGGRVVYNLYRQL